MKANGINNTTGMEEFSFGVDLDENNQSVL